MHARFRNEVDSIAWHYIVSIGIALPWDSIVYITLHHSVNRLIDGFFSDEQFEFAQRIKTVMVHLQKVILITDVS